MQEIRASSAESTDISRTEKLRAEDLEYFDSDFESEHNEVIVSSERHVYYRDMFV